MSDTIAWVTDMYGSLYSAQAGQRGNGMPQGSRAAYYCVTMQPVRYCTGAAPRYVLYVNGKRHGKPYATQQRAQAAATRHMFRHSAPITITRKAGY